MEELNLEMLYRIFQPTPKRLDINTNGYRTLQTIGEWWTQGFWALKDSFVPEFIRKQASTSAPEKEEVMQGVLAKFHNSRITYKIENHIYVSDNRQDGIPIIRLVPEGVYLHEPNKISEEAVYLNIYYLNMLLKAIFQHSNCEKNHEKLFSLTGNGKLNHMFVSRVTTDGKELVGVVMPYNFG